MSIRFSQ